MTCYLKGFPTFRLLRYPFPLLSIRSQSGPRIRPFLPWSRLLPTRSPLLNRCRETILNKQFPVISSAPVFPKISIRDIPFLLITICPFLHEDSTLLELPSCCCEFRPSPRRESCVAHRPVLGIRLLGFLMVRTLPFACRRRNAPPTWRMHQDSLYRSPLIC